MPRQPRPPAPPPSLQHTRPAAGYGRVSTLGQEEEGVSLDVQIERCRAAALAAGYPGLDWYEDPGLSGGRADNRPELQRLMAAVRAGQYDAVYVLRLDRLSRSVFDGINIIRDLIDANVRLVSVSEGVDLGSAMGRMIVMILLIVAQWFLDTLHESVRGALRHIRRSGRHIGNPPHGYQQLRDKQPLQIDAAEAPITRRIYAEYAAGASLLDICRDLNSEGLLARGGKPWRASSVRGILRNRTVLGEVVLSDGTTVPGLHEALIDYETWAVVAARLAHNATLHPRQRNSSLAPLYRCGICGGAIHVRHNSNPAYTTYRCADRQFSEPAARHAPCGLSVRIADGITWRVLEWLIDDGMAAQWQANAERTRKRDGREKRRAKLQAERDQTDEAILRNARAHSTGAVSTEHLRQLNAPLMAQLAGLDAQLAELAESADAAAVAGMLAGPELLYRTRRGSVEEQLRFLQAVLERVELHPDCLRYVWRYPGVEPLGVPRPAHKRTPDQWFTPPQE